MNIEQARENLMSLLDHPDLRLSFVQHLGFRESVRVLYEGVKKQDNNPESEKKVD